MYLSARMSFILYFGITAYIMGFSLQHLSTYLPILELKIVCPIWHLLRFTKVVTSKSNFYQMWEKFAIQFCQFWSFQRLPNFVHAHYNSDGCRIW